MSEVQNINIVEDAEGELRVSSLIIAGRTENQHASVLRIVRDNLADFETFGQVGFEIAPGYNNSQVTIAHLNEPQATLLMTYMRNSEVVKSFKIALVAEFYRMRQVLSEVHVPKSLPEALRAYALEVEKSAMLEAKVIADEPKVEYVDTYVADNDLRLLRNVAKQIGVTESELRVRLIHQKWIYAEHMTRWSESKQEKETVTRYSPYAHKAQYFQPVPNHLAPRFKGEVMHTLKVTPAGATAIARLYGKHLVAVEAVA